MIEILSAVAISIMVGTVCGQGAAMVISIIASIGRSIALVANNRDESE